MAQFFALLARDLDRFSEEEIAKHLEPEAERARQLYAQGVTRSAWSRHDKPGAMLLLEAENAEAAQAAIDSLPLYALGMLKLEALVAVGPYRGFGPRT